MSYLIAVATSDAKVVDLGFGAAKGFHIYEVEGTSYKEKEYREFAEDVINSRAGAGNEKEGEDTTAQISKCAGTQGFCGGLASGYGDSSGCNAQTSECGDTSNCGRPSGGCGDGSQGGCGAGSQSGCGGSDGALKKVELIADCRSLVCKKIGFQAQKQLEKKAIAGFDVDCSVDEALTKIATYFDKIDNHVSLRRG